MAYCNVNQFKAKKLLETRDINNIDQVEQEFKASVFYAWNIINIEQETSLMKGSSIPSLCKSSTGKNRRKSNKTYNRSNLYIGESDQKVVQEVGDQTIIPVLGEYNGVIEQSSSIHHNFQETVVWDRMDSSASIVSENRVEMIFPTPGLILNELFYKQLYKSKSNMNKRNSAIIDCIRLIFQNIK